MICKLYLNNAIRIKKIIRPCVIPKIIYSWNLSTGSVLNQGYMQLDNYEFYLKKQSMLIVSKATPHLIPHSVE